MKNDDETVVCPKAHMTITDGNVFGEIGTAAREINKHYGPDKKREFLEEVNSGNYDYDGVIALIMRWVTVDN